MESALLSLTASTMSTLPFSKYGNFLSLHRALPTGHRSRFHELRTALLVPGLGNLHQSRFQFLRGLRLAVEDLVDFMAVQVAVAVAAEGGEAKPAAVAPGAGGDTALTSDVIVLGVGGMTCGGCAESVRKILESQPQVSSASVNLKTETAIVWPVSEAKAAPNWRKDIGEALAKHLTNCGFKSNLKDEGVTDGDIQLQP